MSKRVALVIGNSRYTKSALINPVNDASAMCEKLSGLGFEVIEAIDLVSHRNTQVLNIFEQKIKNADVALLFYAGHGFQIDGKNYLISVDAEINTFADLDSQTIKLDTILKIMTGPERASLIFLDACRDNPLFEESVRSLSGSGNRSFGISRGLARVEKVTGTFIAYATGPGEVAPDGKGKNSPFTAALLEHIDTPATSIGDIMIDVRKTVLRETGQKQEPWELTSLRTHFYFVEKQAENSPEQPNGFSEENTPQLYIKPQKIYMSEHEPRYWQEIANSEEPEALEEFLKKYPNGDYAYIAKARLSSIKQKLKEEQEAREKLTDSQKQEEKAKDQWCLIQDLEDLNVLLEFAKRYSDTSYYKKAFTRLLKAGVVISNTTSTDQIETLQPGSGKTGWFQEEPFMPQMVLIPSGSFQMGSPEDQAPIDNETPLHEVTIDKPFAVGRFEVTFEEWQACLDAGGCKGYMPNDQGWGRSKRPVINVNWHHVQSYLRWLNKKNVDGYRLPTEAEWEYAARGGTTTQFYWGDKINNDYVWYFGTSDYKSHPVGQKKPNPFGL